MDIIDLFEANEVSVLLKKKKQREKKKQIVFRHYIHGTRNVRFATIVTGSAIFSDYFKHSRRENIK